MCESFRCVIFSASSRLEHICSGAFSHTRVEAFSVPDSAVELGGHYFGEPHEDCCVTISASSQLERICASDFLWTGKNRCQFHIVLLMGKE